MTPPPRQRARNMIRELYPPAQVPQGETRIYASRVKSALFAAVAIVFVALAFWAASLPRQTESSSNPLDGLALPLGVLLFSASALMFIYYAATPIPLFTLNTATFRYQRYPWKHVEIAWSDIRSISPRRESGYAGIGSNLIVTIDMKEAVALTYPYGPRPRMRIPGLLLGASYTDIVTAISQYKKVTLIGADWFRP